MEQNDWRSEKRDVSKLGVDGCTSQSETLYVFFFTKLLPSSSRKVYVRCDECVNNKFYTITIHRSICDEKFFCVHAFLFQRTITKSMLRGRSTRTIFFGAKYKINSAFITRKFFDQFWFRLQQLWKVSVFKRFHFISRVSYFLCRSCQVQNTLEFDISFVFGQNPD